MLLIAFRTWVVRGAPLTEACPTNTGDIEKCLQPVIPVCKDRNIYCKLPPTVSIGLMSYHNIYISNV